MLFEHSVLSLTLLLCGIVCALDFQALQSFQVAFDRGLLSKDVQHFPAKYCFHHRIQVTRKMTMHGVITR